METIKSSAEITGLFNEGRRIGARDLTLIVSRNEEQHGRNGRAAFIAGKKQGNAVWRNRAKRRMRAACQAAGGPLPGYDIIFLAKRSTNTADFPKMVSNVSKVLEKLSHDEAGRETDGVCTAKPQGAAAGYADLHRRRRNERRSQPL